MYEDISVGGEVEPGPSEYEYGYDQYDCRVVEIWKLRQQ